MDLKEVKERMQNGKLYFPTDEALLSEQAEYMEILYDFNNTRPSEGEKRAELLKKLLGGVGKNCYVEPPLHANWGCNTYMGDDVYANFNLTLVDDVKITIGNHVMFAPNVTISAAGHPVEPGLRYRQAQYNLPVTIGDNVWIGAGTVSDHRGKYGDRRREYCDQKHSRQCGGLWKSMQSNKGNRRTGSKILLPGSGD